MIRPGTLRRLALLFCLAAVPASAARYLLELKTGGDLPTIMARYGLMLVRPLEHPGGNVYLVSTVDPVPTGLAKRVSADPKVSEFEAESAVHSGEGSPAVPSVPSIAALATAIANRTPVPFYGATVRGAYVQQWAATLINLPAVQRTYASGGGIVAVIDTGVDPTHPALKNALVPGYDFTRDQPGFASELADLNQSTVAILDQSTVAILDGKKYPAILNQSTVAILDQSTVAILDGNKLPQDFGHGTMVSGLIHLVAPTARIMPLKAFKSDGSANLSDIVRAIYFAVNNGARVINMSFSSPTDSPSIVTAMQYAWSHNVICVASGGNDGRRLTVYPAADRGVIGVGSTNASDRRSSFSNYGAPSVRMAAPGEALITTYPGNNYAGVWGTSFSTALTSGAVALLAQLDYRVRPEKVSDALEHGHRLDIDGMGDSRLDVLSTILYYLTQH